MGVGKIITADRTNQSRELHNLRALAEYSKGSLSSKILFNCSTISFIKVLMDVISVSCSNYLALLLT